MAQPEDEVRELMADVSFDEPESTFTPSKEQPPQEPKKTRKMTIEMKSKLAIAREKALLVKKMLRENEKNKPKNPTAKDKKRMETDEKLKHYLNKNATDQNPKETAENKEPIVSPKSPPPENQKVKKPRKKPVVIVEDNTDNSDSDSDTENNVVYIKRRPRARKQKEPPVPVPSVLPPPVVRQPQIDYASMMRPRGYYNPW